MFVRIFHIWKAGMIAPNQSKKPAIGRKSYIATKIFFDGAIGAAGLSALSPMTTVARSPLTWSFVQVSFAFALMPIM